MNGALSRKRKVAIAGIFLTEFLITLYLVVAAVKLQEQAGSDDRLRFLFPYNGFYFPYRSRWLLLLDRNGLSTFAESSVISFKSVSDETRNPATNTEPAMQAFLNTLFIRIHTFP